MVLYHTGGGPVLAISGVSGGCGSHAVRHSLVSRKEGKNTKHLLPDFRKHFLSHLSELWTEHLVSLPK